MSQFEGDLLLFLPPRDIINNISVFSISAVALLFGQIVSVCFIVVVGSSTYCTKFHNPFSLYQKHFCPFLLKDCYSETNVTEPVS